MASLEIGDRVKFAHDAGAPETIDGNDIGAVIHVYRLDGEEHNRVDVRFPSLTDPLIGRMESEFELVLHHGTASTA